MKYFRCIFAFFEDSVVIPPVFRENETGVHIIPKSIDAPITLKYK